MFYKLGRTFLPYLIRDILLSVPVSFSPTKEIGDLVWNEKFYSVKTKESLAPVLL